MTRTTKIGLLVMTLLLATAGQASADAAHSAPTQCLGFIQPNEVRVYLQTGYVGPCYSLFMGTTDPWTAYDVTYGFPNDAVRSVKAGSNVSVTLFWNSLYTGDNGAVFTVPASSATRIWAHGMQELRQRAFNRGRPTRLAAARATS
jgi:hypothetical protein